MITGRGPKQHRGSSMIRPHSCQQAQCSYGEDATHTTLLLSHKHAKATSKYGSTIFTSLLGSSLLESKFTDEVKGATKLQGRSCCRIWFQRKKMGFRYTLCSRQGKNATVPGIIRDFQAHDMNLERKRSAQMRGSSSPSPTLSS